MCMYIYIYIYLFLCVCVYVCMYVSEYVYVCLFVWVGCLFVWESSAGCAWRQKMCDPMRNLVDLVRMTHIDSQRLP